ncbi:MAG TPA: SEC-C metal-binding domain-containing protein [Thermoanaerobaculia bacterium]|nr:SEC-C metal-binding domain-containing protein [Thermoanaerobaculia bacterium]
MDQEQEGEEVGLGAFLRLLREAVGQIIYVQHGEPFLSWMRVEAPRLFPEVFGALPEPVRRALATELGWQLWNATPLPRNDFRPRPLRRPRPADPCPCRSGREYGLCCAGAPEVPGLTPGFAWALLTAELPLDTAVALAEQGAIPRPYVGIVARRLVESGRKESAASLFNALFEDPELLDRSDMDSLDALAGAHEMLGRGEEVRLFIERFTEKFLRKDD